MLEKDIQKDIIDVLTLFGFLVVKFNNVGIYKRETDSYIPPRQKGISDLLVCAPDGRFIAIEVKQPKKNPTSEQNEFLKRVEKNKGTALVMRSIDDALRFVKSYKP